MEDPWSILGLDPNTATEKDVKVAYAKLLKVHRPDKDPEGFQRVRDAYLAASRQLQGESPEDLQPGGTIEDPASKPTAAATQHAELPLSTSPRVDSPRKPVVREELVGNLEILKQAIAAGSKGEVIKAVKALEAKTQQNSIPSDAVAKVLTHAFADQWQLLADTISDSFTIAMLKGGESGIVDKVLAHWSEEQSIGLAQELTCQHHKPANEATAITLARLAISVALPRHKLAHALADSAYPHLPSDLREHVMEQLESEIAIGKTLHGLPSEMKRFWRNCMTSAPDTVPWSELGPREMVNYLIKHRPLDWEGWEVIVKLVPQHLFKQIQEGLNKRGNEEGEEESSWQKPVGLAALVVVVILFVMYYIDLKNRPKTAPSQPSPQRTVKFVN